MAIKNVMQTMKRGGYIIRQWEEYLLKKQEKSNDRAFNVNAPSMIGSCLRARFYSRTGEPKAKISAKAERIFNNGSYVHERIQKDLRDCGILLLDEVPVFDLDYQIQGHTDGIIKLNDNELGVLEIKSINSRNFSELKTPQEHHVAQGLVYLHCVEKHRQRLHDSFSSTKAFAFSWAEREECYRAMYGHLHGGSMYTAEEKLRFQLDLHRELDRILFNCEQPLTKCVFLYECKDNQDLKEFTVDMEDTDSKSRLATILKECSILNKAVENNECPARPTRAHKNCGGCRWCNYQDICYIV